LANLFERKISGLAKKSQYVALDDGTAEQPFNADLDFRCPVFAWTYTVKSASSLSPAGGSWGKGSITTRGHRGKAFGIDFESEAPFFSWKPSHFEKVSHSCTERVVLSFKHAWCEEPWRTANRAMAVNNADK